MYFVKRICRTFTHMCVCVRDMKLSKSDGILLLFCISQGFFGQWGDRVSTLVKALCYKSEGRWFDPRWCHWQFFIDIKIPSDHTMALGSTLPLTEMITRSISWGVKEAGLWGWQPYHHPVPLSRNLGTVTSWNPLGLFRPVMGLLYLYLLWAMTCLTVPSKTGLFCPEVRGKTALRNVSGFLEF